MINAADYNTYHDTIAMFIFMHATFCKKEKNVFENLTTYFAEKSFLQLVLKKKKIKDKINAFLFFFH